MSTTRRRPPGLHDAGHFGERRADPASSAAPATASPRRARRRRAAAPPDRPGEARRSTARRRAPRRVQHVGRPSTAITRRTYGAMVSRELSGPASQIADDERRVDRARAPPTDRTCRQTGRSRSRSQSPAAVAKNSCDFARRRASTPRSRRSSWPAAAVAATCSRISGHSRLAPGIEVVERHAVEAAGAVAPRGHPVVICQRLQVPAHARLRRLQHGAQLRHRQLVLLEQQQHTAAGRIGQRRHVVENRDHISVNPDGMLHRSVSSAKAGSC